MEAKDLKGIKKARKLIYELECALGQVSLDFFDRAEYLTICTTEEWLERCDRLLRGFDDIEDEPR